MKEDEIELVTYSLNVAFHVPMNYSSPPPTKKKKNIYDIWISL